MVLEKVRRRPLRRLTCRKSTEHAEPTGHYGWCPRPTPEWPLLPNVFVSGGAALEWPSTGNAVPTPTARLQRGAMPLRPWLALSSRLAGPTSENPSPAFIDVE